MNKFNLTQACHHEAGHIVYAYLVNWKVKSVRLNIVKNDVDSGSTIYDFGNELRPLDFAFHYANGNNGPFHNLGSSEKEVVIRVARKRIIPLSGGPIAEFYHSHGIDFKGNGELDFRGPDALIAKKLEFFLANEDETYHTNTLRNILTDNSDLMKLEPIWKSVKDLSKAIEMKADHFLDQIIIENILEDSGYFNYLKSFE